VFGLAGQTQLQTGANPNLRPSTAKTTSLGLAVTPAALKGLSVSVDFIHARQENLIGSVGVTTILQSVDQLGAASPYAAQVAFLDFPGEKNAQRVTRAGELGSFLRAGNSAYGIFVADTRTNLAGQRVKAVDVAVDYAFPTRKELGDFRAGTTGTFFLGYQFQALPTQAFYEYAGYATNGGTGAQGTIPDYRFYSSASWRRGAWNVGVGHTYVPGVTDIGPGGITFATSTSLRRQPVASYSAWDLSAGYTVGAKAKAVGPWNFLRGMKVTAGVNNLGNRMPPLAPQAFNESNVDIAAYSVIGRLFYIDASVKF
jgi:iron complex outermembrane receptor protein